MFQVVYYEHPKVFVRSRGAGETYSSESATTARLRKTKQGLSKLGRAVQHIVLGPGGPGERQTKVANRRAVPMELVAGIASRRSAS